MKMREDIQKAFASAGGPLLGSRKALKLLEENLSDDEHVAAIAHAQYGDDAGLITLTNTRLIFTFGIWTTQNVKDFPLSQITSISQINDVVYAKLTISVAADRTTFTRMNQKVAKTFVKKLREAVNNTNNSTSTDSLDATDQLLKLKQLLDAGVLTQDEYEAKASVLKSAL